MRRREEGIAVHTMVPTTLPMVRVDSIPMVARTVDIGGDRLVAIMEDADSMDPLAGFLEGHRLFHHRPRGRRVFHRTSGEDRRVL